MGLFIALPAQSVHHPLGALGSEWVFRKAQLYPQVLAPSRVWPGIRAWGAFICWCLFPHLCSLRAVQLWDCSVHGFQAWDKSTGLQFLNGTQSPFLFLFYLNFYVTNIIDFEGCVFWGMQPHESVVDVHKLYYLNLCICGWMHIVNWSFLCPAVGSCWLYTSNLLVYIC